MKKILASIICLAGFASCDYIADPNETDNSGGTITPGDTVIRKVLLEDYTGHTCINCPDAAEIAEQIEDIYGEKVVTMGVHVGFFAMPSPPGPLPSGAPAGSFTEDFTSQPGDDYDQLFQLGSGLPTGMVNRKDYPSGHGKNRGDWAGLVASYLAVPPDADIEIINNYNSSTRLLNTTVESRFLNSMSGQYKLAVLLVQDSIVGWQENQNANPSHVQNYVHRHVLRSAINGNGTGWGDTLGTDPASNSVYTKYYNYNVANTYKNVPCDDSHCYVVAFIYNAATYEVIQAEEKKIK